MKRIFFCKLQPFLLSSLCLTTNGCSGKTLWRVSSSSSSSFPVFVCFRLSHPSPRQMLGRQRGPNPGLSPCIRAGFSLQSPSSERKTSREYAAEAGGHLCWGAEPKAAFKSCPPPLKLHSSRCGLFLQLHSRDFTTANMQDSLISASCIRFTKICFPSVWFPWRQHRSK